MLSNLIGISFFGSKIQSDGWKSVQGMENLSNNAPSIIYYKGTDFYLKLR
jgi:hypothetical protein